MMREDRDLGYLDLAKDSQEIFAQEHGAGHNQTE